MTTTIEYALMAGASYIDTRNPINRFPTPQNWVSFNHQSRDSGFEAISFTNGTDIVISYAGTNPNSLFDPDNAANIGLATGFGSDQLLQAAEYYLQVKAANPNANITFTGHSLGGGLAALMGVFFGNQAVTFDQAPFANSAELNLLTPDVAANLRSDLVARLDSNGNRIYADAALAGLTNFLQLREINGGIPNSDLVSTVRVDGEFTSCLPVGLYDPIGTPATVLDHGPYFSPSIDMHSQALLTAFLQSQQSAANGQSLSAVTKKLTNLLGMIFDEDLFARDTDKADPNFLEHLVRHQAGVPDLFPADGMLTHFMNDMGDIAQAGGQALSNVNLNKALIAFGLQAYYEQVNVFTKEAFESFGGGMRFDRAMIAGDLSVLKGYELYFLPYLEERFTGDTLGQIRTQLPSLQDWFIASGAGGAMATADDRTAFMLGADKQDRFTGSSRNDLIVGDAGNDLLEGAKGDDTLVGGTGTDTYYYRAGDGHDTLVDSDNLGRIVYLDAGGNSHVLHGGVRPQGSGGAYTDETGRFVYTQNGDTLSIALDGVAALTVQNFTGNSLHLALRERIQPVAQADTIQGTAYGDGTESRDLNGDGTNDLETLIGTAESELLLGLAGNDIANGDSGQDRLFGAVDYSRQSNKNFRLAVLLAGIMATSTAWALEDSKYHYKLEHSQDSKVCSQMLMVFNTHFKTLWQIDSNELKKNKFLFPPLTSKEEAKFEFVYKARYSKYPTSPEFEKIQWKEGRFRFQDYPLGEQPMLVAEFDIDNDGVFETVIKDGFMQSFYPSSSRVVGGTDGFLIYRKDGINLDSTTNSRELFHGQVGRLKPAKIQGELNARWVRPFILDEVTYLAAYRQKFGDIDDDSHVVSDPFRSPEREYMYVVKYKGGGDNLGNGKWSLVKLDEICRYRMVVVK